MVVFVEEGKWENPEKNLQSKAGADNKLNLHMVLGQGPVCQKPQKLFGPKK